MMDEALHALEGDVETTPWIHWRWGRMDASSITAEMRRQETKSDGSGGVAAEARMQACV